MRAASALLCAILVAGSIDAVSAHEPLFAGRTGAWRARLVSSHDPAPGVHLALLPGRVPGVFLENSGALPVVILGRSGEPFLRFTADGVDANVRSPLWRENAIARGEAAVAIADPRTAPEWTRVSRSPRLAWIEFRAWPGVDEPKPSDAQRGGVPPRRAWAIPARIGGRSVSFTGLTTWER